MFTTPCFIRKNTPELRDKLKELGYHVCSCTSSKTAIYLMVGYEGIHAVSDEVVDVFEDEVKAGILESIDCEDDENLLMALAALRDDSDYMQWFTNGTDFIKCEREDWPDMFSVLCSGRGKVDVNIQETYVDSILVKRDTIITYKE